MSEAPARRQPAIGIGTIWCLLAGAFLAVAPHGDLIWNDGFHRSHAVLHDVLGRTGVRCAISVIGIGTVLIGLVDVIRLLASDPRK